MKMIATKAVGRAVLIGRYVAINSARVSNASVGIPPVELLFNGEP